MFQGIAQIALDDKGRLAIPAKHRDVLRTRGEGKLVLTADPSGCLLLYPQPEWEPIRAKLMSLSGFNPQIRNLQRVLVGYAEDVEMDGSGRILVSPPLRQFAGLEKQIALVGQGNKFEVWDDAKWQAQTAAALAAINANGAVMPPELEGFSL